MMKRLISRIISLMTITAAISAAAMEENMLADPKWEVTTLSNALEIVELPYSGTGFETWHPVDRFIIDMGYFRTDLDENGRSELQLYWYSRNPHFDGEDSKICRYEDDERYLTSDPVLIPVADRKAPYAGAENTQYLEFDSSNVMYRTVLSNRHNSQEGHDPYNGWNQGLVKYVAIGKGSLIFDGLVQFVSTDLDEPHGYSEDVVDDKVVIWLHAIDEEGYPTDPDYIEGHTNLIITAAFLNNFNEGNFVYDYVITCTNTPSGEPAPVDEATFIRPREWHRLTITAYEDISSTPANLSDNWVGFTVMLDGVELSTGVDGDLGARGVGTYTVFESLNARAQEKADSGCLFPALIGNRDYANDIVAVGFQGAGACDDLRFSEGPVPPPETNPELTDAETAAIVNGVRYATFAEAIKAASSGTAAEPAEMKLVHDVVIGADDGNNQYGYGYAAFTRGWIVLDMNGHTLKGTATAYTSYLPYTIYVEGAHLTIENTGSADNPESLILPIQGYTAAYYRYSGELAFNTGDPVDPPVTAMLCMIGNTRYETFGAAMAAWNPESDAQIELLDDVADTNRYLISDYVLVNKSGNTLKVDFELANPGAYLEICGEGDFTGEVTANTADYAYGDGWEFYADEESGSWALDTREFPKLLNPSAAYSAENPFIIADRWDLQTLAAAGNTMLSYHYLQIADIDLDGIDWTGIGAEGRPFKGIYDGGSNAVTNLTLAKIEERYNGFFTEFAGTLRNLRLETSGFSTNGTAATYSAGVVAAYVNGTAKMSDVRVEGQIMAVGSVAAFAGLIKNAELTLKNCENRLTQNVNYYGGESVAFVVAVGKGGSLVGKGGNRASESLAIVGSDMYGTTDGFEVVTVASSIATYDPTPPAIKIGDLEIDDITQVFKIANSTNAIVFSEAPSVTTNIDGSATNVTIVAPGGTEIDVPEYYAVSVDGNSVKLALDEETAKPQISVEDGESGEDPIEITETTFTITIANVYEGLYYRLVYAETLGGEWTPASEWVKGSEAGSLTAGREGDARYYAVQVTDVP